MISTMWTLAPAGARGPVGPAVRAAACLVESPLAARLRAVPATPAATPLPGGFGIAVTGTSAIDAFGTTGYPQAGQRTTTEHNGTTLGIHSSRRPSS